MKDNKKIRNVVALALMLGMGYMGTAEAAINLGDVDGSGVVDMRDIDALEKYLQTGNGRFLVSSKNADVNLNNKIDREDLRLLKQHIYYPGDVNGDNLVDDKDVRAAKEYMATGQYTYLADLSHDGTVTLQDYTSVRDLVEKAKSMIKGDLNNDGKISISDVSLVDMYIKGLTKNINRLAADMNNDGRIDSTDKKIIMDKFFNVSRYAPDGEVTSLYSPSAHVLVVEGSVWDNDDLNRDIVVQVNAGPNASDSKQFTVPRGSKRFSQRISFPNVSGVQTVNVYALDAGENRKDKLLKSAQIDFKGIVQPEKYVVTTNGATLALRSGPGTNYGIKTRMARGSVVEVYSISNGWAELSYNGTRGYASAQYLQKNPYVIKYVWPIPASKRITVRHTYSSGSIHSCRYYLNGNKRHPLGIDIASPVGNSVYAVADGRVGTATDLGNRSFGKYVEIVHNDGTKSLYAHLSYISVSVGQTVAKGQMIGRSGESGKADGAHLHFELSNKDPYDYYRSIGVL